MPQKEICVGNSMRHVYLRKGMHAYKLKVAQGSKPRILLDVCLKKQLLLACLLACLLTSLLAYLLASLFAWKLACLLAFSLVCLIRCLSACILACLIAVLLVCEHFCQIFGGVPGSR